MAGQAHGEQGSAQIATRPAGVNPHPSRCPWQRESELLHCDVAASALEALEYNVGWASGQPRSGAVYLPVTAHHHNTRVDSKTNKKKETPAPPGQLFWSAAQHGHAAGARTRGPCCCRSGQVLVRSRHGADHRGWTRCPGLCTSPCSPEASSCMWQAICSQVFTSDTVQYACDGEMAEGGNMLTAASHWLPSPWLACQSGPARGVVGKEWSHPCCGQPLFPPFSCPSKVGRAAVLARSPQDSPSWRLIMALRRYQPTRPPA